MPRLIMPTAQQSIQPDTAGAVIRAALAASGIPLTSRHERAIAIVVSHGVSDDRRRGHLVQSQSGDKEYHVSRGCECPDADKGHACKHVLAVEQAAREQRLFGLQAVREDAAVGSFEHVTHGVRIL